VFVIILHRHDKIQQGNGIVASDHTMDNESSVAPSTPTTPGGPQPLHPLRQDECDYDDNPTVLYQAIEAKEWEYAIKLFSQNLCEGESGTWIIRKETNGKLRWRLLPLHAAIIFGSPVKLVECLLADYPAAAQCKDDRGMLPLHLAFRNEGSASWEIIEELVSVYPQAIFVKDRKGRTPLQCGIQLTQVSSTSSTNMSVSSEPPQSKTFKSIVTVLDLYSQIVVSGERQRSQKDARKQVEAKITQMQENHLQTLTTLKKEWTSQQEEAKKEIQRLKQEQHLLRERVKEQQMSIENLKTSEVDLQRKLEGMSIKMRQRKDTTMLSKESCATEFISEDLLLESTAQQLLIEQKEYHNKFHSLMERCERLTNERKQVLDIFNVTMGDGRNDEQAFLDECRQFLEEKEDRMGRYRTSLSVVSAVQIQEDKEGDEKKEENDGLTAIRSG
jgi:hypothetical protein